MDWTIPLRSQQADFIERLKSGHLLHCEKEGQHSELTVISGERLKQLVDFCWEMAEKYKRNNPVRKVFIGNMKGKLGEEVVKVLLDDFVTEVNYEKRIGGDGKVDFTLTSDSSVGLQVKTRYGNIDKVQWEISPEEVNKNSVLVCILSQEQFDDRHSEYKFILAGFMPTSMIDTANGKNSFKINELLYSGALKSYLENLETLESDGLFIPFPKIQQQGEQSSDKIESKDHISNDSEIKAYAYLIRGINREKEGNWKGAIEDYSKAISLEPKLAIAYEKRGDMWRDLMEPKVATEDYTQAIRLITQFTALLYSKRAYLRCLKLGDKQGAIQDSNQAIVINSEGEYVYRIRARVRYEIGDYQGAIEDYTEAMRLATQKNSGFTSYIYYWRGQARYGLGDIDGAIEDYSEGILLEPIYFAYFERLEPIYFAYFERAIAFSSIGHYQESIENWTHLLKTSEDGLIYYFRGLTRFRWGDKQGAIEDLEKSTKDLKISYPQLQFYQKVQDMLRELKE